MHYQKLLPLQLQKSFSKNKQFIVGIIIRMMVSWFCSIKTKKNSFKKDATTHMKLAKTPSKKISSQFNKLL